jgi:hypothetical protein
VGEEYDFGLTTLKMILRRMKELRRVLMEESEM